MGFALSGTTITQTGTDSDLAGLAGISGVTIVTVGNVADRMRIMYIFENRKLVINGHLSYTHNEELLFQVNSPIQTIVISAGASLTLGEETELNGSILRPDWCPLTLTKNPSNGASESENDIQVDGSYTQYGGLVVLAGGIVFEAASTVLLSHGKIIGTRAGSARIRQHSLDLSIINFTVQGQIRFDFFKPAVMSTGFRAIFGPFGGMQALSSILAGGSDEIFAQNNFDAEGLTYGGDAFGGARVVFKNLVFGKEFLFTHNRRQAGDTFYGVTEVRKEFQPHIVDMNGNNVEGARIFIRDTNNGNRPSQNGVWHGGGNVNYTLDRIYNEPTGANGKPAVIDILTRAIYEGQSRSGVYPAPNDSWLGSATVKVDYRSLNNSWDDVFPYHVWSYAHQPRGLTAAMIGGGILAPRSEVLPDTAISNPNMSQVAAYTGIAINHSTRTITISADHTLDELYDYVKYNKIQTTANMQQPSISTILATADGRTLDISNYNVNINAGITLSAGTKFNAIRTSGNIPDKLRVNAGVTDSSGQLVVIASNVADTRFFVEINNAGTITTLNQIVNSDGNLRITVPVGATLKVTAKARGFNYIRRNFDTTDSLNFSVELAQNPNVDIGDANSIDDISDTLLSFNYVEGGRSQFVFGEINLRNQIARSIRVFDDRMTSAAALEFLHQYNNDGSLNHILGGSPYQILPDRIYIYSQILEFVRLAGLGINEKSFLGIAVFIEDQTTAYKPPVSNGDDVRIDNVSKPIILNSTQISTGIVVTTQNPQYLTAIKTPIADEVKDRLVEPLDEIQKDIDEIDEKLGNTINPIQIYDVGGTEHGQLGVPNISALARIFSVNTLFQPNTTKIHIDIDQVSREGTGPPISFNLDIYAMEDTDTVDVAESFTSTTKYDIFRSDFASRRIFHQDEDSHVRGRHTVGIPIRYNRILVLFRNNNPVDSTLIFRFNEFRISLEDAMLDLVENSELIREKTDALRFTGVNENSKVNAETDQPDLSPITTELTQINNVAHNSNGLLTVLESILNKIKFTGTGQDSRVKTDLQTIKGIDAKQLTTHDIRLQFLFGISPTNPNNALDNNDNNYSSLSQIPTQYSDRIVTVAAYSTESDIFPEHSPVITLDLDGITLDPGGVVFSGWLFEIYLLQDVDTLSFPSSGSYNLFRSHNASRRAFSINTGGHARPITLKPNYPFNRIVIMFRHAEFAGTTLHARYDNLKLVTENAIRTILANSSNARGSSKRLDDRITDQIVGRIDTAISSRLSAADYTATDSVDTTSITDAIAALQAAVNNIPTSQVSLIPLQNAINDLHTEIDNTIATDTARFGTITNRFSEILTALAQIPTDDVDLTTVTDAITTVENTIEDVRNTVDENTVKIDSLIASVEKLVQRGEITRSLNPVENREEYIDADGTIILAFHTYNASGHPSVDPVFRKVPLTAQEIADANS